MFSFTIRSSSSLTICMGLLLLSQAELLQAEGRTKPQFKVHQVAEGSSGKTEKAAALANLPLKNLTRQQQETAHRVLKNLSVFRRLPTISFEVEPDVYQFFASQPDVAVSLWRVMEISKFQMTQTSPVEYQVDAGDGSVGTVQVLQNSPNSRLIYCDGKLKSPFIRSTIQSQALIHLQTTYYKDQKGEKHVSHRVDLFVSFPSQTIETVARVISPMSNKILDKNFEEISLFLNLMSQAMKIRPAWVENLAQRMDGVVPTKKAHLSQLTESVHRLGQSTPLSQNVIQPSSFRQSVPAIPAPR